MPRKKFVFWEDGRAGDAEAREPRQRMAMSFEEILGGLGQATGDLNHQNRNDALSQPPIETGLTTPLRGAINGMAGDPPPRGRRN